MHAVDVEAFENSNPDFLLFGLADIEAKQKSLQNEIDDKIKTRQSEKYKKEGICKDKISEFKNPSEKITAKFASWRSDVNGLPNSIELVSEFKAFLKN